MRTRPIIPYIFLLIMLVSITIIIDLHAAAHGQIKGLLTDKETGKPIYCATVLVVGTNFGAITDIEGKYIIKRLEPGTYTLRIAHLEYNTYEIKDIQVVSDSTCEQNLQLTKKVTELDKEITVTATLDILSKYDISNEVTIGKDLIEHKPVTTVDELLTAVSGVTTNTKGEKFIRGCGRSIYPPAHGGTSIVNGEAFDAMFFKNYGVNPFVDTEDDHLSTFAIDVDDASFILARSYLNRGALPHKDAVRTEEFINHFDYSYDPPKDKPFNIHFEGAPSFFGQNSQLLKIGIKGKEILSENRKDANLVFVVDISGSMSREDRLGLVKKALRLLVDELNQNDKVGIVVYGNSGYVHMQPKSIAHKEEIINSIEALRSNGSTNAEEGIKIGYKMADRMFEKGKINRIILCSDGVANVGRTGPDEILKQIKKYADKGITLSSIGFGMGNYNDVLLEKLGNKGNGSYAYVDDINEAKRIFVENLTGNLQVIARDVKIQVDFNPEVVRSYRLLGYENRDVADDKFRDDKEDGGEIGSGHEVTALYEIKLHKQIENDQLGTVYVRWKDDEGDEVTEINRKLTRQVFADNFFHASYQFRLAACVAEYAEILRKSYWAKGSTPEDLLAVTAELLAEHQSDELIELVGMITKTKRFDEQLAQK